MPRIKATWYSGEMRGKCNSCRGMRWSLQGSEWKSNSKNVDDMTRLWRLKLESKETPTPITKATGRRRDIDETLMPHDVRASREAAGTSSRAVKSSIQKGTWLYRRQADPKALRACQNTPRTAEDLTKETVLSTVGEQACCDARPSRIRLTHRKSESHGTVRRLLEMASSWRVRVASLGSTQVAASERVRVAPPRSEQWRERVAPPELMGGSSRTVLTSKQTSQILEQIGTRESHLVWTSSQTRSQAQTRRQETHRPHTQGWRFAPDAILPRHRRAHWWVPARTPTVHQCPHSGKAVGGPQQATRDTTNTTRPRLQCHAFVTNMDEFVFDFQKIVEVNPTHSTRTELKEAQRASPTRHEEFEFSEQAEIVEMAHTIPHERIPNPILEQIVVLDMRNVEDHASREHRRGEDAQSPQEDDVGRGG